MIFSSVVTCEYLSFVFEFTFLTTIHIFSALLSTYISFVLTTLDSLVLILFNSSYFSFYYFSHNYRRYAPYDSVTGVVDTASVSADGKTYTNPKYLVVIVTGASGDREHDSKCGSDGSPSLTCTENYGYLIWTPLNATVSTSSFHTVQADGPGPADYTDEVTIITDHRVSTL